MIFTSFVLQLALQLNEIYLWNHSIFVVTYMKFIKLPFTTGDINKAPISVKLSFTSSGINTAPTSCTEESMYSVFFRLCGLNVHDLSFNILYRDSILKDEEINMFR
jgi:hypothetical protein